MKHKIILSVIASMLLSAGTTFAQPLLAVDFQTTTSTNLAAGFSIWDGGGGAGASGTPQTRTFGAYTITLAPTNPVPAIPTAPTMGWRVRTTPLNTVGFTQSDLYRDFVFASKSNGLTMTISGLTPLAEYHFKFYSLDSNSGGEPRVSNWSANGVPVVYRHTFFGTASMPVLDDQFAFRFNATADDAGQIVIEGLPAFETTKANDIAVFLNAFEMHPGPQFPQPPREIFWCETGGFVESQGSVWSCGFNGVGKTAIATGLSRPLDVALDAVHGHIYWAEDGSGSQPSRIVRANFDGSNQTVLFNGPDHNFSNAQALALDLPNGHIYWTTHFDGIRRGNTNGTGYTVLGGSASKYTALDLDLVNGHIYYGDPTQLGLLFRMDLNGANDGQIAGPLSNGDYLFNSISLDVPNGHIYYTDLNAHQIKRMNLDGSNQITLTNDAGLHPHGIALGAQGTLYWVGGLGQRLGTAKVDGVSNLNVRLVPLASDFAFGIDVLVPLHITSIALDSTTATVSWKSGQPPYQLQQRTNLAEGTWENVGAPTTATQATNSLTAGPMFYRVQGN